jgi:hypothetical protein
LNNIFKFWLKIASKIRYYQIWSYLYRKISKNQRKASKQIENVRYPPYKEKSNDEFFKDLRDVKEVMSFFHWKKDGFKELFDVVSTWKWAEYKLRTNSQDAPFDCDDFANYACHLLRIKGTASEPLILSVIYRVKDKFFPQGHAVCLIERGGLYYHIGNWGVWGPFKTKDDVIKSICGNNEFLCFETRTPENLACRNFSTKMPDSIKQSDDDFSFF